jgi:hypothetical protein
VGKLAYSRRLIADVCGLARQTGAWWLVPLLLVLLSCALLVFVSQSASPFVYPLF